MALSQVTCVQKVKFGGAALLCDYFPCRIAALQSLGSSNHAVSTWWFTSIDVLCFDAVFVVLCLLNQYGGSAMYCCLSIIQIWCVT